MSVILDYQAGMPQCYIVSNLGPTLHLFIFPLCVLLLDYDGPFLCSGPILMAYKLSSWNTLNFIVDNLANKVASR